MFKKIKILISLKNGKVKRLSKSIYEVGKNKIYFIGNDKELNNYLIKYSKKEWVLNRVKKINGLNLLLIQTNKWTLSDLIPTDKFFYSIEKESNVIIHIPHKNIRIPEDFISDYLIKDPLKESIISSDIKVDYLIPNKIYETNLMIFNYSRIFLDVERLPNDELEKEGRGKIYTSSSEGLLLRHLSKENREKIEQIYDSYHEEFKDLILKKFNIYKRNTLIVDLHSFTDYKNTKIDICLGFNDKSSEKKALKMKEVFEKHGFKVSLNYPYSNSIQPIEKIDSVMIEVNKDLYFNKNGYFENEDLISAIDQAIDLFVV